MKKVRKALYDILVTSLNTTQINDLGRGVDSTFDVHTVSGFSEKIVVSRQVAASCLLDYFAGDQQIIEFINFLLSRNGQRASGGIVRLRGVERLIRAMNEKGWIYNESLTRFVRDQRLSRTSDWGVLEIGREYNLIFSSIDVVHSSHLVRTNTKDSVEVTMTRLRRYLLNYIERKNGRFWNWHGDGGLVTFYGEDSVQQAVLSMIQILSYLPVFNISQNEMDNDSDIQLRIGMHYGLAEYQHDVSKITSEDIHITMEIEKNSAISNSIVITRPVHDMLWPELRRVFFSSGFYESGPLYMYYPT